MSNDPINQEKPDESQKDLETSPHTKVVDSADATPSPDTKQSQYGGDTYQQSSPTISSGQKPWYRRALPLIVVFILVAAIAAGAVTAWYFISGQSSQNQTDDELANSTRFESPTALVDQVKPELKGEVLESQSYNGVSSVTTENFIVYSAPAYKLASKEFTVLPKVADGAGYRGDSVSAKANYSSLKAFFEDNKFKLVEETKEGEAPVSSSEKGALISYAVYESRDIICAIRHVDASATELQNHVSGIGCAERKSFEEAARDLQPFYDAYMTGGKGEVSNILMGGLTVEDGAEGYKRAIVYVEDPEQFSEDEESMNSSINTLYYQKPSSDTWEYFTGVETHPTYLYCSSYTNDDAKKAFRGFGCYDEKADKDTTVS